MGRSRKWKPFPGADRLVGRAVQRLLAAVCQDWVSDSTLSGLSTGLSSDQGTSIPSTLGQISQNTPLKMDNEREMEGNV